MITDQDRKRFEAAIWAYYERIKAAGWSAPQEGAHHPEALFWREPSGKYGVAQIEAAWWGWKLCREAHLRQPVLEDTVFLNNNEER